MSFRAELDLRQIANSLTHPSYRAISQRKESAPNHSGRHQPAQPACSLGPHSLFPVPYSLLPTPCSSVSAITYAAPHRRYFENT